MSWENIVKSIAPVLGTALGGPLGGIATKFITDALGIDSITMNSEATRKKITSGLTNNLENLQKIKDAELNFKKEMKKLDIQEEQLRYQDVKNARENEIKRNDSTQTWLTFIITGGFFSLLSLLLFVDIDNDVKNILNIMVGSLGTAWVGIVNYYYGSSVLDSRSNTDI